MKGEGGSTKCVFPFYLFYNMKTSVDCEGNISLVYEMYILFVCFVVFVSHVLPYPAMLQKNVSFMQHVLDSFVVLCILIFSLSLVFFVQVKNSSLKIMQDICKKLDIPQRNPKLFPFGEPAAADGSEEGAEGKVEPAAAKSMLQDEQPVGLEIELL